MGSFVLVLAMANTTLSTRTLNVSLGNVRASVQHPDGRWEIQPSSSSPVTVLGYATTDGSCGAVVNSPGRNAPDVQSRQVSVGTMLHPGDVMLVASTLPGSSQCDDMVSIHVVPWAPDAGYFTGPALGSRSPDLVNWARKEVRFSRSQILLDWLPSVVDIDSLPVPWGMFGKGKPSISWILNELTAAYDIGDQWGLTGMPVNLMRPYGREFASRVSVALLLLCSTLPKEQKRPLAELICQMAIDLAGAYLDGRVQECNGGHFQGRKAVILLGMALLRIAPQDWVNVLQGQFQEDLAYADVSHIPWAPGWRYGWRGHVSQPHEWSKPLNQWNTSSYGPLWYVNNYMHANVGVQIGTALGMRLLKLTPYMSNAMDGFVQQWMEGPDSIGARALAAIGGTPAWGTDFCTDRAQDFCAAAWRKYAN